MKTKLKILHPYQVYWEPLEQDAGFLLRPMFGGRAVYLDGRLRLFFVRAEEPWRGLLVCTDRERQPALQEEFSALAPHPVLPKWLYVAEAEDSFESAVEALVRHARQRDSRFGIEPRPKKKKARRPATRPGS